MEVLHLGRPSQGRRQVRSSRRPFDATHLIAMTSASTEPAQVFDELATVQSGQRLWTNRIRQRRTGYDIDNGLLRGVSGDTPQVE
jgi:hypothetical protein